LDERYSRQVLIPEIGEEGQKRLSRSSVLVVGAGGLGSPVLTYLAAAGIGHLGIVDDDTVTLSNLNRQFLHNTLDIGKFKVDSAKEKLTYFNNEINIVVHKKRLENDNVKDFIIGYDLVIGAVDSFKTRYVINKACVYFRTPYIDGGINGFSGCVLFSNPPHTPCLKCIFPKQEKSQNDAGTNTGVLGTTAGIIGTIEANIAILHLLKLPNPAENKLLIYDGLKMNFDNIDIKRNEKCPVCSEVTK